MEIVAVTTLPNAWADPVLGRAQAEALLATSHHYLLVTKSPFAAGYLLLQAMPGAQADILTIFVKTQYRSQKIGNALLTEALEMARSKGCEGLTLEVATTNEAAIRLYEQSGFQKRGTRVGYYRDPVRNTKADAIVMAVLLT